MAVTNTPDKSEMRACGRSCKWWSFDMDGDFCAHEKSFEQTSVGLSCVSMSRAGLCFHGSDDREAAYQLWEPSNAL